MKCTECNGLLERRAVDGRQRNVCFVCGKSISAAPLLDVARVFGKFCLWLVGLFVLLVGVQKVLRNPRYIDLLHKGLRRSARRSAPPLQRMREPADYDWPLTDLSGRTVSFDQFKNKVVLLNFWAAWCAPCRSEMPSVQRLFDHFKNNPNIAIVGVNIESLRDAKNYLRWGAYTFPIFVANRGIPKRYNHAQLPTSYIISREGQIVAKQTGARSWDDPAVIRILEELL